jgi:hypothetical protein
MPATSSDHVNTGMAASNPVRLGSAGRKRHRGDDFIARSPCLASGGADVARRGKPAQRDPRAAEPLSAACGGGTRSVRAAPAAHGPARRSLFSTHAGARR